MQYVVQRQIAVEADSPEQAIEKTKPNEGSSISVSANPRPTAQASQVTGSRAQGSQIPSHMTISKTPTTTETKQV